MVEGLLLVTPARPDEERDLVAAAWERAGGRLLRLDRFWEPPAVDPAAVRLYGPTTFALVLEQLWPIRLVSPPVDALVHLPPPSLGRAVGTTQLGQVAALELPVFLKPSVSKAFRALVHHDLASVDAETRGLPGDTPVVWSEPVAFAAEVRCWCLDRTVHAWAAYEGRVEESGPLLARADAVLRAMPYAGPVVVDLGLTAHGWVAIELNEAWGAGTNGCDPAGVVEVLAAATVPA